ncbi:hypothetical protein CRENBAI_005321 [Crenichthys baileyi]|uniref:Uncharacterized protein n=1 Tax=Crenichthys baileyi TaxID=28760 RepID=A0AAV9RN37_9TELE
MRRRFTVNEALDHIFAANEAEDTQDFSDGDEQAFENEHDVEYQLEETDTTDQSEEEVTGAEAAPAESLQSKRGNIRWSTVPPDVHGRTAAANIIKMTPGVTRFAVTRLLVPSLAANNPVSLTDPGKAEKTYSRVEPFTWESKITRGNLGLGTWAFSNLGL